ncbi:uncharacterized protein N7482_007751 [Penicillium canariense]|uniref:Transcription factor Iwr1 domain-containing protein n=1 Tax=Penicillium canariense TaxID=189055 RepID=A0A9W9HXD0_9EURO|nr:uncharacterized protein N7482_007751 [Penicillium canariense]KAJ5160747.1 hypothetical protein N7482_007751 [Penicillium canariense]
MTLPPEQINIKRRREEEPVETLYIQSALHQTKRRFTDYVFQRVTISSKDGDDSQSPPGNPAAQRLLRSPRSVSSLHVPNRRAAQAISASGVPLVRATSPGAEIREAQRMAAERKDAEEQRQRALQPQRGMGQPAPVTGLTLGEQNPPSVISLSTPVQSVRRFQISRSNSSSLGSPRSAGGIQKRRADGAVPGVAVLVEQLRRQPHSRQASMVADLVGVRPEELPTTPVKPRKRPVVNQAEKRWREERKSAISAAKQHLAETLEKSAQAKESTWDEETDRLAKEFEQVALELEQEQNMDVDDHDHGTDFTQTAQQQQYKHIPVAPPKPMKYQPRPPKQPRAVPQQPAPETEVEDVAHVGTTAAPAEEDDDDYVYDVYIRRPLAESDMLRNPLAELESEQQMKQLEAASRGIGVIVITAEDEEYWEHFVEDDEQAWDSEDADSNAEDNPANDYPDEEASSSDEDDDPSNRRQRGAYDDWDSDMDGYGSEYGDRYRSGYGYSHRYGGNRDSDEDSG